MTWDPTEKFWRDRDAGDEWDPNKAGPEYQMWAKRAEGLDMAADSRGCEKEPARCARCDAPMRFEFRLTRSGPIILTPWPVAICLNGHREEL